ncbi:serine-rich adhesin for platelets-like [Ruditapes philippinarum]|uniref:serine-rich adhesin for platelets-like n=1 Tax=Ruditapes philippinarum TaxID=129788 RepID=UPI00295B1CE3|nr:serine-rich adhesin for platelets-like [Ruditapes philippinarum]XP_060590988.1 serine-rich adhesin for platelets-like [Ruditapes philippinarum]
MERNQETSGDKTTTESPMRYKKGGISKYDAEKRDRIKHDDRHVIDHANKPSTKTKDHRKQDTLDKRTHKTNDKPDSSDARKHHSRSKDPEKQDLPDMRVNRFSGRNHVNTSTFLVVSALIFDAIIVFGVLSLVYLTHLSTLKIPDGYMLVQKHVTNTTNQTIEQTSIMTSLTTEAASSTISSVTDKTLHATEQSSILTTSSLTTEAASSTISSVTDTTLLTTEQSSIVTTSSLTTEAASSTISSVTDTTLHATEQTSIVTTSSLTTEAASSTTSSVTDTTLLKTEQSSIMTTSSLTTEAASSTISSVTDKTLHATEQSSILTTSSLTTEAASSTISKASDLANGSTSSTSSTQTLEDTKTTYEKVTTPFTTSTTSPSSSSSAQETTTKIPDCPDNWITYGQSCYLFSNESLIWTDARIRCENLNGYLVEITSADEDQFLVKHANFSTSQINEEECFTTRGYEYSGFKSTTANGITCQRWDSQTPHRHTNTDVNKYPENSLADAANYCRDPDRTGKPWCYTVMSSTRWQLCGINRCEKGM